MLDVDELCSFMDGYACVSFDVFDTLLYRGAFAEPHHLFRRLALSKGLNQQAADTFARERIKAEALCRERARRQYGHAEVHLRDVYAAMHQTTVTAADEVRMERDHLRPRPFIRALYDHAVKTGKRVFAISDFYLDDNELTDILSGCGYTFERVYSSCSHHCGKYDGQLYKRYLEESGISPSHALHIGDNYQSDFIQAMMAGLTAYPCFRPVERLECDSGFNPRSATAWRHRAEQSNEFGRTHLAYMAYRHEEVPTLPMANRFAIQYAIPMIVTFARWLIAQCHADGIHRLYLMARDGHILHDVVTRLAPDLDCRVIPVSRRAVLLPAAARDRSMWDMLFTASSGIPIANILDDLQLELASSIRQWLPQHGEETFDDLDLKTRSRFLNDSYRLALPQMQAELTLYSSYASSIGLFNAGGAVVDVGWNLNSHKALDTIAGHRLHGYYLGALEHAYWHSRIKAFLFSPDNRKYAGWRALFRHGVELLELPFVSTRDQTTRITPDGFQYRYGYLPDRLRGALAITTMREVQRYLDFAGLPGTSIDDFEAARNALESLFSSLIERPTKAEYEYLSRIPHDRYIAGNKIHCIGDYWVTSKNSSPPRKWPHGLPMLLQKVLLNFKLYGFRFTVAKILWRIMP